MQMTEPGPELLSGFSAVALIAIGIILLQTSRGTLASEELGTRPFAWTAIAIAFALFIANCGVIRGLVYAFLASGLGGYLAVALNITLRPSTARSATSLAAEPEDRPTNWRRATAKAMLAIVLAGFAAFGLGEAFAVAMPFTPPDRIVIGALLVPILWGAGMAWTLADSKLLRAAIALSIIAATSFAIAFLPRVFH